MDLAAARALAEGKLREIEDPANPLALNDEWGAQEIEWAFYFPYDSVRYLETRSFTDMVPSGPIVVNKDGSDIWVAGSAPPLEERLNEYAAERGYPLVPTPPPFSFSAG